MRSLCIAAVLIAFGAAESYSQAPPGGGKSKGSGNKAPVVTSLFAYQITGNRFRVTGTVSDETPTTCTVAITGAGTINLGCDSSGNFSGIVNVPSIGTLTATPNDGLLTGSSVSQTLQNAPPTLSNFVAVPGDGNTWVFSGTVADEATEGLSVTLSGLPSGYSGSATLDATGSFSITVTLPAGSSGEVTGSLTDWYGSTVTAVTYFGS
ncbi:hypothetical protein [Zavarzinella formosa]|uniref:hypothetical protein n=1 Tax=Zavarzinella formosa TaxID=360055 RepID=UPI0002DD3E52|nr:hypothetical protein [Zavarzinella formosa]